MRMRLERLEASARSLTPEVSSWRCVVGAELATRNEHAAMQVPLAWNGTTAANPKGSAESVNGEPGVVHGAESARSELKLGPGMWLCDGIIRLEYQNGAVETKRESLVHGQCSLCAETGPTNTELDRVPDN